LRGPPSLHVGHLRREGEIGETEAVGRIERMEVRREER
jgi:hypothetical protein